jgi:hypothetical protein
MALTSFPTQGQSFPWENECSTLSKMMLLLGGSDIFDISYFMVLALRCGSRNACMFDIASNLGILIVRIIVWPHHIPYSNALSYPCSYSRFSILTCPALQTQHARSSTQRVLIFHAVVGGVTCTTCLLFDYLISYIVPCRALSSARLLDFFQYTCSCMIDCFHYVTRRRHGEPEKSSTCAEIFKVLFHHQSEKLCYYEVVKGPGIAGNPRVFIARCGSIAIAPSSISLLIILLCLQYFIRSRSLVGSVRRGKNPAINIHIIGLSIHQLRHFRV